jgi:hypothetical protein
VLFEREDIKEVMARLPIELVEMDTTAGVLPVETASFDAITSFDSPEHWLQSPRRPFETCVAWQSRERSSSWRCQNAVNARKRVAVLLGKRSWSRFEDWYEHDRFVGPVREPVISDLERMADELGLQRRAIVGRNWLGARRGPPGRASALPEHEQLLCSVVPERRQRCAPAVPLAIRIRDTRMGGVACRE